MAKRPVFLPNINKKGFVEVKIIEFEWFPGYSISQKQKSIKSLHENIKKSNPSLRVLEISSKSYNPLGVSLSAFNLMIETKNNKKFSVENAFQASKVFEKGGPYIDLLEISPRKAKRDPRLKSSGKLLYFQYFSRRWPLEPKTLFYDWLYINALALNKELSKEILEYNAFTDIEFNPKKSINCQAKSAALYVALKQANLLDYVLASSNNFMKLLGNHCAEGGGNIVQDNINYKQMSIFDNENTQY